MGDPMRFRRSEARSGTAGNQSTSVKVVEHVTECVSIDIVKRAAPCWKGTRCIRRELGRPYSKHSRVRRMRAGWSPHVNIMSTVLAVFGLVASVGGASAVEEPPHQVVVRDGDFEIRDYPALTVAETTVDADRDSAGNQGFRRLAGYIFGGNAKKQSIEMTAPVIEAPAGVMAEKSPGGAKGWIIRFVMPQGFSLTSLPKPDAEGIVLREEPPSHVAVLRFSGLARDAAVTRKTAELEAMLKARNLSPAGPPVIAQYDQIG